ncbi:GAF domain-containing protein [Sphingomonas sp.]|uniref:GAF domain-containing protein n=1 Tax=Sphingomonas sp. TaxID=28214 RepID=UPI0025DE5F13|nr:GAF domain-containing protein [Sphingomonas sp.]MBV9529282.1 GAF domain-containing protein [Sphingomonas sp.]
MASTVTSKPSEAAPQPAARTQSCGFVLELSPDWLIIRASENAHAYLGEYPARLIGEPLSSFTLAQPLHDLRNSLARQRSSNGIARAYRARLTHEPRHFDIAFQQLDNGMLLEFLPSGNDGFGDALGAVSRLLDGMTGDTREALCNNAARRMRALTGFDRVTLVLDGTHCTESARSPFAEPAGCDVLPSMLADAKAAPVGVFPVGTSDGTVSGALLRGLTADEQQELAANGVRSALCVPLARQGRSLGHFRCESRTPWTPSLELHAAAELFAQMVGIELERL